MRRALKVNSPITPRPRRKPIQGPVADAGSDEAEGWVADGGGHAANLAVAASGDDQWDPSIGDGFAKAHRRGARPEPFGFVDDFANCGAGWAVFQGQAIAQGIDRGGVGRAFNLGDVGFGHFVFGMGDLGLEFAIVGQEQQALAIAIQPTSGINARDVDKIGQGLARCRAIFIGEL